MPSPTPTSTPTPITLIGATGLTGAQTLSHLLLTSHPFSIKTIARKAIPGSPAKNTATTYTHNLVSDLFDVPKAADAVAEKGGVYVSCLGTTRASAGSFEMQEKLDYGLNLDLARRAKEDGAGMLILVSSGGSSSSSLFPYTKMKGRLEDAVKALGFERCIILQPALLLGPRSESRMAESMAQHLFRGLRAVGVPSRSLMIDAEDVGACIAHLAANPPGDKTKTLGNSEIISLAQAWRGANPASSDEK